MSLDIVDALLGEHGAIYALLDRIENDLAGFDDLVILHEQVSLLAAVLVSHALLEDELLFQPALAAGGPPPLQAMLDEHREIEACLERGRAASTTDAVRSALQEAIDRAREHFAREEQMAFPLARGIMDPQDLAARGEDWARRRGVVLV